MKRRRAGSNHRLLVPIIVAVLAGSMVAAPAFAFQIPLNIQIDLTQKGTLTLNFIVTFPQTVSFLVKGSFSDYHWDFGDGSTSTTAAPEHAFNGPCVYHVKVNVRSIGGQPASGGVVLGLFDQRGSTGGALAVCPAMGTAGFSPTSVTGAYFAKSSNIIVYMNGKTLTSLITGTGDWSVNATGLLPPRKNGTVYTFTSYPQSLTRNFTTVEGISVSPGIGAPGDAIAVLGASYPADTTVTVSLGGVSLGTAQSDGNGSFRAQFEVPSTPPITTAGTYAFTTDPPILGSQASFQSIGGGQTEVTTSFESPPSQFPWWWIVILVLVIAVLLLVILLLWRRSRKKEEPMATGTVAQQPPTGTQYSGFSQANRQFINRKGATSATAVFT